MTRIIGQTPETLPDEANFALGTLAAAGHTITDEARLDLLGQLNRGEIDFGEFKRAAIELGRAE